MMSRFLGRLAFALPALLAAVVSCLLIACFVDGRRIEAWSLRGSDARHLERAQRWTSPSISWLPPATLDTADDKVMDGGHGWTAVALPDSRPIFKPLRRDVSAMGKASALPQVVWYSIDLGTAANGAQWLRQIYIPRIDTQGSAALYLDGELIWHSGLHRIGQPFYVPILLNLDIQRGSAGPSHHLYVRMSARAIDGGVMSSVWAGYGDSLTPAYVLRSFLQNGILISTWAAYWVLGGLSLLIWLQRRNAAGSAIYLYFAETALFAPAYVLPYICGELSWMGEELLLFLWVAGGSMLMAALAHFSAEVIGRHQPIIERLARWGATTSAVWVAYCIARNHGHQLSIITAEKIIWILIIDYIFINIYQTYIAIRSRKKASCVFAFSALIGLFSSGYDTRMSFHTSGGEALYLSPLAVTISFVIYVIILLRSHVGSLVIAENASVELAAALAAKESELELSHRQLLHIQQQRALSEERQRMMREMHDGIGASLVSALRFLQHGQKAPRAVLQVLEECIDDLKLSIDSLEPVAQDLLMLLSSLRFRLGSRLQGSGIALHWDVVDVPALVWLDAPSGMHILRILQEILTNLLKHSDANSLRLSTAVAPHDGRAGVVICVEDNGRPFTPDPESEIPAARKGLGNILSRTKLLNGQCRWQTLAEGNRFILWLPQ